MSKMLSRPLVVAGIVGSAFALSWVTVDMLLFGALSSTLAESVNISILVTCPVCSMDVRYGIPEVMTLNACLYGAICFLVRMAIGAGPAWRAQSQGHVAVYRRDSEWWWLAGSACGGGVVVADGWALARRTPMPISELVVGMLVGAMLLGAVLYALLWLARAMYWAVTVKT